MRAARRGKMDFMNAAECPVSFWRFAAPVVIGSAARYGARALARRTVADAHPETQDTAANVAGIAAFWLAGGIAWIVLTRRAI